MLKFLKNTGDYFSSNYFDEDFTSKVLSKTGYAAEDIKEFNNTEAADTVVGKGVMDIGAIMQELKDQQFKGMISIEQESNWYNSLPDVTSTVKLYYDLAAKLK